MERERLEHLSDFDRAAIAVVRGAALAGISGASGLTFSILALRSTPMSTAVAAMMGAIVGLLLAPGFVWAAWYGGAGRAFTVIIIPTMAGAWLCGRILHQLSPMPGVIASGLIYMVSCVAYGVWTRRVESRRARGVECESCGYSLIGLPRGAVCPECGTPGNPDRRP